MFSYLGWKFGDGNHASSNLSPVWLLTLEGMIGLIPQESYLSCHQAFVSNLKVLLCTYLHSRLPNMWRIYLCVEALILSSASTVFAENVSLLTRIRSNICKQINKFYYVYIRHPHRRWAKVNWSKFIGIDLLKCNTLQHICAEGMTGIIFALCCAVFWVTSCHKLLSYFLCVLFFLSSYPVLWVCQPDTLLRFSGRTTQSFNS